MAFFLCTFLCLTSVKSMPSSIVELLAGYIYGFSILSLSVITAGKVVGCTLSFLLARYLFREFVSEKLERRYAFFKAIRFLVKHDPIKSVVFIRLALIPMALKNYGLGVTDIPSTLFVVMTLITGIPFTVVLMYMGSKAKHLRDIIDAGEFSKGDAIQVTLLALSMIATLFILGYIGYYTKQYMSNLVIDTVEEEDSMFKQESEPFIKKKDANEVRGFQTTDALV